MFGSNCRHAEAVPTYEAALKHWQRTPLPRGTKWEPHQRPLDDSRKHHYRLEMGAGGEYFDAVLYGTRMMRVHKPTPDGRRVQYTWRSTNTSDAFLWQVCHVGKVLSLRTTDGRDVQVPIGTTELGTDLWFTDSGSHTIDVSRSRHQPTARVVRSQELLQWRKDVLTNLAPLFQILEFQAEELRQKWEPPIAGSYCHPGSLRELSGATRSLWALQNLCKGAGAAVSNLEFWRKDEIEVLRTAYADVVKRSLDVRDYRELEVPSTDTLARQATRTLLNYMEAAYSLSNGPRSRRVPLPDFPESLPRKFVFL